jgi:tetratricopeptide (TPR) repeat protein
MLSVSMSLEDLLCWFIVLPVLGVMGYRCLANSENRKTLIIKWVASLVLILSMVGIGHIRTALKPLWELVPSSILCVIWVPSLLNMLLKPMTSTYESEEDESDRKPFYYIAEAKRRKGLFQEAIAEVLKQLEKFPGDYEGMMKMATIQAEHLRDVSAAKTTIDQLLEQPGLPPNNAVAALQTLADWQMNIGRDAAAARASFERIIQTFPDSSYSHAAEQRVAHLEGVTKTRDFREKAVFKVPTGERDLGLRQNAPPPTAEDEAENMAQEYVRQLQKYPNDTDTREKLALLYADQFQRLDLAVGQLEQLAALPNESPKHVARWLDLLATLHIRHGHDLESAEHALRRIIDSFPQSAAATRALERLATLEGEWKAAATSTAPKALGVYERDLGLKK